jgi:protein TonB
MFANFLTAIPTGATMTLMILFGMQALIAMQPVETVDRILHDLTSFLPEPRDEELRTDEFHPDQIDDIEPAPPLAPTQDFGADDVTLTIPTGTPLPKKSDGYRASPFTQDGPLVAMVRVSPTYPTSMSTRGIEGWVTVQFDVLPDGTVGNVTVLKSSNRSFERSAIQAAGRFRFKAQVVDGVPQTTTGVQYRFRFELDK